MASIWMRRAMPIYTKRRHGAQRVSIVLGVSACLRCVWERRVRKRFINFIWNGDEAEFGRTGGRVNCSFR